MKILYPFVAEAAHPDSVACMHVAAAAGHDVRFRELHGPYDYWAAMCELFAEGEAFLNIEHDIVISPAQVAAIEACDQPICAYGYGMVHEGDILPALRSWVSVSGTRNYQLAIEALAGQVLGRFCLGLGATKFSERLVQSAGPGILAMEPVNFKWLEFGLQGNFREHVGKYHHHQPDVVHY